MSLAPFLPLIEKLLERGKAGGASTDDLRPLVDLVKQQAEINGRQDEAIRKLQQELQDLRRMLELRIKARRQNPA